MVLRGSAGIRGKAGAGREAGRWSISRGDHGDEVDRAALSLDTIRSEAEAAVRALPPLVLPAAQLSHSIGRGSHGRRKSGPGDAFWQFRPYHTGDPAALIDWRRSARSDVRYVRQNEWETAQNVWLWCDLSNSMLYRSAAAPTSKIERAMSLAVGAAMLLVAGGERVGYAGAMAKPTEGRFAIARVMEALDMARFSESAPLPDPEGLGRHPHLVAIGDFLTSPEDVAERIRALSSAGVSGHIIHIVDPAEEAFPFKGRLLFQGLEGEESELVARAEAVADSYARRMDAWQKSLADLSRVAGWTYTLHHTDRPPHSALIGLMGASGAAGSRGHGPRGLK